MPPDLDNFSATNEGGLFQLRLGIFLRANIVKREFIGCKPVGNVDQLIIHTSESIFKTFPDGVPCRIMCKIIRKCIILICVNNYMHNNTHVHNYVYVRKYVHTHTNMPNSNCEQNHVHNRTHVPKYN